MTEITPSQKGVHYKHPTSDRQYEIIAVAKNSETLEDTVVYKALYEGDFPFGQVWARPKKEFLGKAKQNGKEVERFSLVKE